MLFVYVCVSVQLSLPLCRLLFPFSPSPAVMCLARRDIVSWIRGGARFTSDARAEKQKQKAHIYTQSHTHTHTHIIDRQYLFVVF